MLITAQIAARIASAIAPEIEALLHEQATKLADLEERLSAANDRATAAESRLDQLRQLLSPAAPAEPVKAPPAPTPTRDDMIATFHAMRKIGPCSIEELCAALRVDKSYASELYNKWCAKTGNVRINYYFNGQRVSAPAPAPAPVPAPVPAPTQEVGIESSDLIIADFHKRRQTEFVSVKELGKKLKVRPATAHAKYAQWCRKNGVDRISFTSGGNRVG